MRAMAVIVALAVGCTTPLPVIPGPLGLGTIRLDVVVSVDASRFHAVDQLSGWYPYAHTVFRALLPDPTAAEAAALDEQRAIRAALPWGHGLEAAYYLGHDGAIDRALRAREDRVIAALAPRTEALIASTQPHVVHFAARLADAVAPAARTLDAVARLFGTPPRTLPVVLVARPGGGVGGGGANGGVLVVEVTRDELSLTPLVHEVIHAMLEPRRAELRAEAARCGADPTAFEEAIVHAVAPGLVHDGGGDPLTTSTTAFYQLGAQVRPAVSRALASGSFPTLLGETCDVFRHR